MLKKPSLPACRFIVYIISTAHSLWDPSAAGKSRAFPFTLCKLQKNKVRQTQAPLLYQIFQKLLLYKPPACYTLVLNTSSHFFPEIHTVKVKLWLQLLKALAASCLPPCTATPLLSLFLHLPSFCCIFVRLTSILRENYYYFSYPFSIALLRGRGVTKACSPL